MFTHIDHIAISVKDRKRSIEFYEKNFGFKKYFEAKSTFEILDKVVQSISKNRSETQMQNGMIWHCTAIKNESQTHFASFSYSFFIGEFSEKRMEIFFLIFYKCKKYLSNFCFSLQLFRKAIFLSSRRL